MFLAAIPAAAAILLGILGVSVFAGMARKRPSKRRWADIASSAEQLDHWRGRVLFEINNGTRASLKSALSGLNGAISRAPLHPEDYGSEAFGKFRAQHLGPALAMKDRAIEIWAEMKVSKFKTAHDRRNAVLGRQADGLLSARDRLPLMEKRAAAEAAKAERIAAQSRKQAEGLFSVGEDEA